MKYVFKPYNPLFPEFFEREKKRIMAHVKEPVRIEHIGSTAVPNLGGKGIIDIAIATERVKMETVCEQLQTLGYEFRKPHSTPTKLYLRADLPDPEEGVRRYHIHLTFPDSQEWRDFLTFRDHLRTHPESLQEYAELKKKAAHSVEEDGQKYRELKDPFFKKTLDGCFQN